MSQPRLLVLGGSAFLGRTLVVTALTAGWAVTTFNRGRSAPDVPGVTAVRGDRASQPDLDRLAGHGPWDAVVDCSGRVAAEVGAAARTLGGQAGRYLFVSSVSALAGWPDLPTGPDTPLLPGAPDATEGEYGPLKAGSERAVHAAFGDRALTVRPGLIYGPYENIGRFWWLTRAARGGRMLAPGDPDQPMQLIDVRDLADWLLHAIDQGLSGAYNATGPIGMTTMREFLTECVAATGSDTELVWVDPGFLLARSVTEWTELPLWTTSPATWQVDVAPTRRAGLVSRPIGETVRDTWAWLRAEPAPPTNPRVPPHGLDPGKEQRLLGEWLASR